MKQYDEMTAAEREFYDDCVFSVRISNVLERLGIATYDQLCLLSEADLLRQENFGRKSLNEVKATLTHKGRTLASRSPLYPLWEGQKPVTIKDPRFYNADGTIKTGNDFLRALIGAYPDRVEVWATPEAASKSMEATVTEKGEAVQPGLADRTAGERVVRVNFNPSGNALVEQIKQLTAGLIDLI